MKTQGLDWFMDRIGKRIYRDASSCDCHHCIEVYQCGLVLHDVDHAQYVYDTAIAFEHDGVFLNYRDEK